MKMAVTVQPKIYDGTVHNESKYTVHNNKNRQRCVLCFFTSTDIRLHTYIYRVSHELTSLLRESVPYVKLYQYNPKHLYPKLNGYRDNGKRSLKVWQLLHTY